MTDLMTVGEVARRSGFAASALRYYEAEGLICSERNSGGHRRFPRSTLRRLAFITSARHIGLTLDEIKVALGKLPGGRTPSKSDWAAISRSWRPRLDAEIEALIALRDGLDSCIGCGCLSLKTCPVANPNDAAAAKGPGAVYLRRPRPEVGR